MKGLTYYGSGDSVQGSFRKVSHQNLAITGTASTSTAINAPEGGVLLSLCVSAHVRVGSGNATTSDFVLPAGVWPLLVRKGETISVLKLSGSLDGQASVIIVED